MARPRVFEVLDASCQKCGVQFKVTSNRLAQGRGKYCSKICYGVLRRGGVSAMQSCQKCTKQFKAPSSSLRKYCTKKCYDDSRRGIPQLFRQGENHHYWAGDRVSYPALHTWVNARLGKPKGCKRCGTTEAKQFEWANISHTYKRDLSDWIRLCQSCHRLYDNGKVQIPNGKNIKEVRKL